MTIDDIRAQIENFKVLCADYGISIICITATSEKIAYQTNIQHEEMSELDLRIQQLMLDARVKDSDHDASHNETSH